MPAFDQRFATAIRAYQQDQRNVEWYGYFGTEFRNITFVGERAAAESTLQRFQVYQVDDRKIRKLVTTGQLRGWTVVAVVACVAVLGLLRLELRRRLAIPRPATARPLPPLRSSPAPR